MVTFAKLSPKMVNPRDIAGGRGGGGVQKKKKIVMVLLVVRFVIGV